MTPELFTTVGWLFIKILAIVGFVIYVIFAGVVVRQEQLMAGVWEEASEPILRILALIHLAAAIFVLVLAILIL